MADALLINPPYCRRRGGGVVPPLGLCYVAAALREVGANPQVLDLALAFPDFEFEDLPRVTQTLLEYLSSGDSPRLIGIGPLVTATLLSTHMLLRACRMHSQAFLVVGGALCTVPGMSFVLDHYLDADAFVAGDGEAPIRSIWASLMGNGRPIGGEGVGLPASVDPSPYREANLDDLPLPARDLLNEDYRPSVRRQLALDRTTVAFLSRGCPYSCTFCAAPLASGKRIRKHSTDRITTELSSCAAFGFNNIVFYDDCLFIRSPHLDQQIIAFAEAIERSDWEGTYQLELRCDAVVSLSDQALRALIATGCRQINMGIEKAEASHLSLLKKRLSPSIAREACDRLNSSSLRAAGTFILGSPGENPSDVQRTIDFATSLPLTFAHFNPLALYPERPYLIKHTHTRRQRIG